MISQSEADALTRAIRKLVRAEIAESWSSILIDPIDIELTKAELHTATQRISMMIAKLVSPPVKLVKQLPRPDSEERPL